MFSKPKNKKINKKCNQRKYKQIINMCHIFLKLTIALINRSKFCYCSGGKKINAFTNPDTLFKKRNTSLSSDNNID